MYHSITFGDKNTWDDWNIIPNPEPIIEPPAPKTNYIDVPGSDQIIDMSEALTGYPVFSNREGSLTFVAMNKAATSQPECNPYKFRDLVYIIEGHLHGKRMNMILEDDPDYFYTGRFTVTGTKSNNTFNEITINYKLDPYKWSTKSSIDQWIWDTFNFRNGVIRTGIFYNLDVSTAEKVIRLNSDIVGTAPVAPRIVVSNLNGDAIHMRLVNGQLGTDKTFEFQNGTFTNSDLFFYGDNMQLYLWTVSGSGKVTIDFRQGRL